MTAPASSVMAMLSVADMDRAMAFYRDLLGGEFAYGFPGDGPPVFATLRFGVTELGIGLTSDAPLHGRPQRPASGHRIELCFYVDDVDATVARLAAAGVVIALEPTDQPWGERAAYAEDSDGNMVLLVAPLSR